MNSRTTDFQGNGPARVVAGYFHDPANAQQAIDDLSRAGFDKKNIGVALWDDGNPQHERQKGGWANKLKSMFSPDERDEYQGADAYDTLGEMGIPEDRTRLYRDALRNGGVLVTIKEETGTRLGEAESILRRDGADFAPAVGSTTSRSGSEAGNQQHRLMLYGEVLKVHKERIQRGEVRVRKEAVSEQQTVQVPVTREEVYVERHSVPARDAAGARLGEQNEIRLPVSEEQVRVEKRPVVREEVSVGKRAVQETRNISDTVTHEELKVENQGDVRIDDRKKRPA